MKPTEGIRIRQSAACLLIVLLLGISTVNSQIALTRALDYDGDRKADPAVFRADGNTWWTLRGDGGLQVFYSGNHLLDTIAPGDFDGDRKGDVSSWRETNGTFYYLRSSDFIPATVPFGQAGDEPVARDYDGDSRTDFAVVRRLNGQLYWHILQSSNGAYLVYQFGLSSDSPAPGDYDGDRRFDLAVQRQLTNGYLEFHINRSSLGLFQMGFGRASDLVVPGDYDGDGATDVAVCRWDPENGSLYEWYILNSTDGSISQFWFGAANQGDVPVQADYDGDGMTDIAVWRAPTRRFYILQSSNSQAIDFQWGAFGDLPVASYDTH